MRRLISLTNGQCYHIFTKSVENIQVFKTRQEYQRMINLIRFYQYRNPGTRYSYFIKGDEVRKRGIDQSLTILGKGQEKQAQILAYCLMPNHIHLVLKQLVDQGISIFIGNILNSYSKYFNTKYDRQGPLWIGKFKNVWVENDEQLLYLTKYIHRNPIKAGLVKKLEKWPYSSYHEYVSHPVGANRICSFRELIVLSSSEYVKFVEES